MRSNAATRGVVIVLYLLFAGFPGHAFATMGEDESGTIVSLEPYCIPSHDHPDLRTWVKKAPVIFSATVLEVLPRMEQDDLWANHCWARVAVTEFFKGSLEKELWVEALYAPYGEKGFKDITDPAHCPVKIHQSYLVFGYPETNPYRRMKQPYVVNASGEEGLCTPLLPLGEAGEAIRLMRASSAHGQHKK